MILDYLYFHENYTENKIQLSGPTQAKLKRYLKDFSSPDFIK